MVKNEKFDVVYSTYKHALHGKKIFESQHGKTHNFRIESAYAVVNSKGKTISTYTTKQDALENRSYTYDLRSSGMNLPDKAKEGKISIVETHKLVSVPKKQLKPETLANLKARREKAQMEGKMPYKGETKDQMKARKAKGGIQIRI